MLIYYVLLYTMLLQWIYLEYVDIVTVKYSVNLD